MLDDVRVDDEQRNHDQLRVRQHNIAADKAHDVLHKIIRSGAAIELPAAYRTSRTLEAGFGSPGTPPSTSLGGGGFVGHRRVVFRARDAMASPTRSLTTCETGRSSRLASATT